MADAGVGVSEIEVDLGAAVEHDRDTVAEGPAGRRRRTTRKTRVSRLAVEGVVARDPQPPRHRMDLAHRPAGAVPNRPAVRRRSSRSKDASSEGIVDGLAEPALGESARDVDQRAGDRRRRYGSIDGQIGVEEGARPVPEHAIKPLVAPESRDDLETDVLDVLERPKPTGRPVRRRDAVAAGKHRGQHRLLPGRWRSGQGIDVAVLRATRRRPQEDHRSAGPSVRSRVPGLRACNQAVLSSRQRVNPLHVRHSWILATGCDIHRLLTEPRLTWLREQTV